MEIVNTLSLPDAALWYAARGFRVFPVKPGAKDPQDGILWKAAATTDETIIQAWWAKWPDANIGLAMGGGLAALDIDNKNGQNGGTSFLDLGGAERTRNPEQRTPSGGRHVLFRAERTWINFTNRGRYGGLDMRTAGGYILGSPSVIGEDKKRYTWLNGDLSVPLPDAALRAFDDWSARARDSDTPVRYDAIDLTPEARDAALTWLEGAPGGPALRAFYEAAAAGPSGDRSKDAYMFVLFGLRRGLSVAVLAALVKDSWLVQFGAEPPHNARDPARWFFRYCFDPAVRDYYADMFTVVTAEQQAAAEQQAVEARVAAVFAGIAAADRARVREIVARAADLDDTEYYRQNEDLAKAAGYGRKTTVFDGLVNAYRRAVAGPDGPAPVAAPLAALGARYVFVTSQDQVFDLITRTWLTLHAVSTAHAREFQGDAQRVIAELFHNTNALAPVAATMTFDPGLPPGLNPCPENPGTRVLNTYRPTRLIPHEGDIQPWLDHWANMQPEEGFDYLWYLFKAMAYKVQNPGMKINYAFLLGGGQGIGKDLGLKPFHHALGIENCQTIEGADLVGEFNEYAARTLALHINEVAFGMRQHGERFEISNSLKRIIAAPPDYLKINVKNMRLFNVPNQVFVTLATNADQPLHIEADDRRFVAIRFQTTAPEKRADEERNAFYARMTEYMHWLEQDGGYEAVYHWLLHLDVSDFNPNRCPPASAWKVEVKRDSASPIGSFLQRKIEDGKDLFALDVLPLRRIEEAVRENLRLRGGPDVITTRAVSDSLKQIGATSWHIDGKVRAWVLRNPSETRLLGARGWLNVLRHLEGSSPDVGRAVEAQKILKAAFKVPDWL